MVIKNKVKYHLLSVIKITTSILLFFTFFTSTYAAGNYGFYKKDKNPIEGVVTSTDGEPLQVANVVIKGANVGVITDFDGNYKIEASPSDILVFSYLGYKTKEVKVGKQTVINVSLTPNGELLEEVVVVGYNSVKREDILGAVGSVKPKEIEQTTPVNAVEAIQGRVPGAIINGGGQPGESPSIQIRGVITTEAGSGVLYVVDGQQLDNIDDLNPENIESIEVLRDGASAAIYGSQSAGGVIIIKTKSGKPGKTNISVNHKTVISSVNSQIPIASTRQRVLYEMLRSNTTSANRDSLSLFRRNSFNLQELIFRTGRRDQTNVTVSGGTKTGDFYWNTGFLHQDGIVVNSSYRRIDTKLKINVKIFDKLKVGTSVYGAFEKRNGIDESQVFRNLSSHIPYYSVFEPDGSFSPQAGGRRNPVAQAFVRVQDRRDFSARSFNYGEFNFLPSLKLRSTFAINYELVKREDFVPTIVAQRLNNPPQGRERNALTYNLLQENILTFKQRFDKHNITALVGNSWRLNTTESTNLRSNFFITDEIRTFNAISTGEGEGFFLANTGTNVTKSALVGYFGKLSYIYGNRYLIDATFRRDGSSRVGENNRFGDFKSFSGGWRLSHEKFLKKAKWLNNLLLRASYGENGNQRIPLYENIQTYDFGFLYNNLNGISFGPQLANKDLKWETTTSQNYGIDLSLFKKRLKISADYYTRETDGLLAQVALPDESGFTNARTNAGVIENKGLELSISGTPIKTKDFKWNASFNISTLKNKVLDVADERGFFDRIPRRSVTYRIEEGESIGNMLGFRNLGVFRYDESNAFTDQGVQLTPNFDGDGNFVNHTLNGEEFTGNINQLKVGNITLEGGDIIWKDLNGDFVIREEDDREIIGNGLPEFFGSFSNDFSYKGLTLSMFFDYSFGNDIFRDYDQQRNDLNSSGETPGPERIEGAWKNPGDIARYPILSRSANHRNANRLINSIYVSDGSYIRLRTVSLAYSFNKKLLKKIKFINSLKLNLSANNIVTWTNYEGYNPDLGNRGNPLQPGLDQLRYPNKTDIIFGLLAKF